MAPPTVTMRVPGVTGTNHPRGTSRSIRVCRLTPAPTVTTPDAEVHVVDGVQPGGVDHHAPGVLGGVAVAAPEAAGDDPPTRAAGGHRLGHGPVDDVGMDGPDHLGGGGSGAAPPREGGPLTGCGHQP